MSLGASWLDGSRTATHGRDAASSLHAEGFPSLTSVEIDVTSDKSIAAAKELIEQQYGRLDVLVNNAGIALDVKEKGNYPMREMMQRTFDVNVFGAAAATETFLPLLEKSPNPRIVFTSSSVGLLTRTADCSDPWSSAPIPAYRVSKAALNMLMLYYTNQLLQKGFKVNASCPDYIGTNLNSGRGTGTLYQGAENLVRLAVLDKDGVTGTFSTAEETRPW
ncbi:putative retinol dehydrogenase [Talaromyces proteolyticus]|uniref:Retinol dehydrogenase n=1 Tax=Talaromyces proteolyticus TaxID=1131652 RepID=A0AAD4Q1C6_9EURO|nr:putative retinol dehydrogenase [Talaromyces proteolyticus]KAH8698398.1 putative retinol dehydrogenase [Talaromyces proteolyticus]